MRLLPSAIFLSIRIRAKCRNRGESMGANRGDWGSVTMPHWTDEKEHKLRSLHLSPQRNPPVNLRQLASHFSEGGSIFGVTEGDRPVSVSKGLARKVKQLTINGELDWLLETEHGARVEAGPSGAAGGRSELLLTSHVIHVSRRLIHNSGLLLGRYWVVDVILANRSPIHPIGVEKIQLEVSRGAYVHTSSHLGADAYGSHRVVPFAEVALERTLWLEPARNVRGMLRFLEPRPFEEGEVQLRLLVTDHEGVSRECDLGTMVVEVIPDTSGTRGPSNTPEE